MFISTQKKTSIPLHDKSNYYIKGNNYYYFSKRKGKSLEKIFDQLLFNKNVVFIIEDIKDKIIYIIFTNSLRETVTVDLENNFSISKLVNLLKVAINHTQEKKVYLLNDSELLDALKSEEEIDIGIINKRDFNSTKNKQKYMLKRNTYIYRGLTMIIGLILIIIIQYVVNIILHDDMKTEYDSVLKDIKTEQLIKKEEISKINNIKPKDIMVAKSYKEVLNFKENN